MHNEAGGLFLGALTFVDDWCLVAVVNQSGQLSQVVLVSQLLVVNLHETDSKLIGLVVDVFELLEGLGAFTAFGLVCGKDRLMSDFK